MHIIDYLFLAVVALSVLTSTFIIGEFLFRLVKRGPRNVWSEEASEIPDVVAPAAMLPRRRKVQPAAVLGTRMRRRETSSAAPDLLTVVGTGYAVLFLPVVHENGLRDVVESQVFLN